MNSTLSSHVHNLRLASERLGCLQSHDALVILKHSLSLPKLLHNLRSSFCVGHPALSEFDDVLRDCLQQILNVTLEDDQWKQATLPVRNGGLGIRKAHQIAPSAYLASATGTASLVSTILPDRLNSVIELYTPQAFAAWTALGGSIPPTGESSKTQRAWDQDIVMKIQDQLLAAAPDEYTKARLMAVSSPYSGDWLNAPGHHGCRVAHVQ